MIQSLNIEDKSVKSSFSFKTTLKQFCDSFSSVISLIKSVFKRKKFEKEENDNHGILFDYKFGTPTDYNNLCGVINQSFDLKIDNGWVWYLRVCFEIGSKAKTVDLTINKNKTHNLNESVKEAILYSMKNITPKRNKTNNIQIKMNIPVAPIIIKCELETERERE